MKNGRAFVIMQIGNPDLDAIYECVMVPALRACSLEPLRVDRHNAGGLLHSEIIAFIEESDILFWSPERLDDFRSELEKRVHRRLRMLSV